MRHVFALLCLLLAARPAHAQVGHPPDKSPYRDPAEEETGRRKDPVAHAREVLLTRGLVGAAELDTLDAAIDAEMDATIDFTIAQTEPPLSTMFRDVYAPEEPEPEPVRTRIARVLARD